VETTFAKLGSSVVEIQFKFGLQSTDIKIVDSVEIYELTEK